MKIKEKRKLNRRGVTLLVFLSLWYVGFGQDSIPVLTTSTERIDIRVGDDYFAKGGWTLDAHKNPDLFRIGSKWIYAKKKVSFITDIDSLSFEVKPGNSYDFIILLNGKTAFPTRIVASANPVFLNQQALISLLVIFLILLGALIFFRNKISTRSLLLFGYVAPIAFWLLTILSGFIHDHYNHLKNAVSELGAIGTHSELFTSCGLLLLSLFCILFSMGFYRASRANEVSVLPAILSFSMPFTIAWAGVFTLGNEFHSLTGPLPFLVILGALLAFLLWKRIPAFSAVRAVSLISLFIMLLVLLRFVQPFGNTYEGLVQRFFYLGWTAWTIGIAYYFRKLGGHKRS